MGIRALRRIAGGILAVAIAGCGLSDYEERMHASQERVNRYVEESDALGEQVVLPTKLVVTRPATPTPDPKAAKSNGKDAKAPPGKDQKAQPKEKAALPVTERKPVISYPFFLRLPKGIRNTPDPDPKYDQAFRYPGAAPTTGTVECYLAFSSEPQANFAERIVRALPGFSGRPTARTADVKVPERETPLNFDVREFEDAKSVWSVYAHSEGTSTVAIVFRVDRAQKSAASSAVDLSLSTLAIGSEADRVLQSLNARKAAASR